MPGQKPPFDLQAKAQANLSEVAFATLTSAGEKIPFILDEVVGLEEVLAATAGGAGATGYGPEDPHAIVDFLEVLPGRADPPVTFVEVEDRLEVTPDRGQSGSHVPDWMDLG